MVYTDNSAQNRFCGLQVVTTALSYKQAYSQYLEDLSQQAQGQNNRNGRHKDGVQHNKATAGRRAGEMSLCPTLGSGGSLAGTTKGLHAVLSLLQI